MKCNCFKPKELEIKVKKLHPESIIPTYATEHSAGMDLYSNLHLEDENIATIELLPGERTLIKTGISMSIPEGFEGQVRPRSGLALKHGISIVNSPGTIDSDYIGDIGIILINHSNELFVIQHGVRIAQLVITSYNKCNLVEVEELSDTERGVGGFGHSGN